MMKAVQQARRHAEFMSEAQRFLASDGEESVLSEGGDDDLSLLRNSSCRDRRGASICRDTGGPELPVHRRGNDDKMDDGAWAIAFAINVVVTVLSVRDMYVCISHRAVGVHKSVLVWRVRSA